MNKCGSWGVLNETFPPHLVERRRILPNICEGIQSGDLFQECEVSKKGASGWIRVSDTNITTFAGCHSNVEKGL